MKSNIYTKTGDGGSTALVDGSRVKKDSKRIEAYGNVDELSSVLGLIASGQDCPDEIKGEITHIQHVMFEIGGYLATPQPQDSERVLPGIKEETEKIEGWIDSLDERLPKLNSFIIPGGTELGCRCHQARTVCRRAERHIIALGTTEYVDPEVVAYINRLSDYLFVAARYMNFIAGVEETAWRPALLKKQ